MDSRCLRLGSLMVITLWLGCLQLRGQQPKLHQLRNSVTPFSSQALTDTCELNLFRPLVNGKIIVAVGEVTHGTHQTAQLQTKLARDLCQSQGFNTVVLAEIDALATLALNRYVLLNQGTLDDALAPLAEAQSIAAPLVDLIHWIHQQNRHRPFEQRIWIVGTEVDSPIRLAQLLRKQARAMLPATDDSILATLSFLPAHQLKATYPPRIQAALQATFNRYLEASPSSQPDSLALLNRWQLHLLSQHQLAWTIHTKESEAPHDSAMFASVRWLQEQRPRAKIVIIIAHNAHIEKLPCYQIGFAGVKRLGHYLHQTYGAAYCALGTEIDGGRFLSGSDRRADSIPVRMPRSRNGMGRLLGALLPASCGLLDLRDTTSMRFFQAHQLRLSYGTSRQGLGYQAVSHQIPLAFDGLVFLGSSRPTDFVKIAPPKRFGVYLALAPDSVDILLSQRQLRITFEQISWVGQPNRAHDLRLQVYQHNRRKRQQSFVVQDLTGRSRSFLVVDLRPRTPYVSISVVGRNGQSCTVGQIKLNGQPVSSSSLQLVTSASVLTESYRSQNSGFWWHHRSVSHSSTSN